MTATELAEAFSVHKSSFHKLYAREGFPERDGQKMDALAVCDWILANCGGKRSKLWAGASLLQWRLAGGGGGGGGDSDKGGEGDKGGEKKKPDAKKPAAKAAAKPAVAKPAAKPAAREQAAAPPGITAKALDETPDEDFGAILDSFRRTVSESVRLCEQASLRGNETLLASRLKTTGVAVEQLRKAEQSILDIQLARKSSLPVDEVRVAFVALASSIRSKLLQLPIKLSHELAGTQSASEAQAILDEEIRMVLNDLSKNPFGDS